MYRVVVQCPASCLAILSDVKLEDGMLDKVLGTWVSVHCRACDATHEVQVCDWTAYRLNGHVPPPKQARAS
jgi:hypothetical protein